MEMKNLAIWVTGPYCADKLFDEHGPLNRDNCLAAFRKLKEAIELGGGLCHTLDVFEGQAVIPDIVIFLDIPSSPVKKILGGLNPLVRKWVVLQECEVVKPDNWDITNHRQFDKIFTWSDPLVDHHKYIKLNFSLNIPSTIPKDVSKKTKLCTLIAGNKKKTHPLELYSKRIEAIRWFETNHPADFDLYGVGWDEYRFEGIKPIRALNRFRILTQLFAPHFPSYRGAVKSKHEVLERYKFAICYENARDIPGYITEKIFDCFFAGCVPVYWGANNVTDHIPADCFVDRRKFASYEDLYEFLVTMPDEIYAGFVTNIDKYLKSAKALQFSAQYFAKTIADEIAHG